MKFLYPIPSTSIVTQTFAEHVHAARVNNWQNYNGGIDWAVPIGSPVVAAQSGKVTQVRNDATGYGHHVRIQHEGGYLTIYAHLMDAAVRVGDKVHAGEVIGRSDNTGNSTGPHLHFELRKNNIAVDPAPLLVNSLNYEQPETEPQPGEEPGKFPKLPKARVTSSIGLNIRQAAGTIYPIVGYLPKGTVVDVFRGVGDGADTWLQIGFQQFIAMQFDGQLLAVWEAQ